MGYSDVDVRVMLMNWAPCMSLLGQWCIASTYIQCGIHKLRVCPGMELGPPMRPVCYALGMPWCTTRPPRVRQLVGMFSCCCCINWCATSLLRGSVRVAVAV